MVSYVKPAIVSAISIGLVRSLELARTVAPLITEFGQPTIVILTIIYLLVKIFRGVKGGRHLPPLE